MVVVELLVSQMPHGEFSSCGFEAHESGFFFGFEAVSRPRCSAQAVGGAAPPSRSEVWYYGAAVLLWRSDVQEWYYPALREGITHVTIDSHNVARTVVELKKDDKAARRMAIEARNVHENHLCPSCLLEHWTYVLTKYNSRFGLRFLDLPATLALLDAKARGEVAVGV